MCCPRASHPRDRSGNKRCANRSNARYLHRQHHRHRRQVRGGGILPAIRTVPGGVRQAGADARAALAPFLGTALPYPATDAANPNDPRPARAVPGSSRRERPPGRMVGWLCEDGGAGIEWLVRAAAVDETRAAAVERYRHIARGDECIHPTLGPVGDSVSPNIRVPQDDNANRPFADALYCALFIEVTLNFCTCTANDDVFTDGVCHPRAQRREHADSGGDRGNPLPALRRSRVASAEREQLFASVAG
jgi:hypothetical protein